MAWMHINKPDSDRFRKAIYEIEEGTPRATVICGACFVEDHLTDLIKWRLRKNEKIINDMFKPGGALGDFGVKINLAYLIGICSDEAVKELTTIKGLRNDFAHKLEINSFANDSVQARCLNLKLWQEIKIKMRAAGSLKIGGGMTLMMGRGFGEGEQEVFLCEPPESITPRPNRTILARQYFINACKFYIAACSVVIHAPHKLPPSEF